MSLNQDLLKKMFSTVDMSEGQPVYWLSMVTFLNGLAQTGQTNVKFARCEKVKEDIICYSEPLPVQPPIKKMELRVVFSQLEVEKNFTNDKMVVKGYRNENGDVKVGIALINGEPSESNW